ncbi:MAG: hypothetical protein ACPIOQ_72180, partial [Promethearchaeia archaeon]
MKARFVFPSRLALASCPNACHCAVILQVPTLAESSLSGIPEDARILLNKQAVVVLVEKLPHVAPQFANLNNMVVVGRWGGARTSGDGCAQHHVNINQALTLPMRLHAQVFEGRLLRTDTTGLVLKLSRGQHGEILMLSSRQVRSIHPRFAEGTGSGRRPERCSYFEDCGKCAFGAGCRKTHDPRLLSQDAQCAVANGEDMAMRQQLTLHLATIPEGYDEARIRQEFAKYGKLQSVNICHKTSLLMGKGKEHWRFVCCPCVCSIALLLFAEAGP